MNRTEQIKGYLKRLGDGESLENVKKDFVKEFNDVNPIEIMEAEQALIAEGTPISEVSKLCDVHSALFHGATKEERIAKAENEISEMKKYYDDTMKGMTKSAIADMRKDRESIFNKLAMISGHPLNTFVKENKAIQQVIDDIKEKFDKCVGDNVSKDAGEYVVSELARETMVSKLDYLDIPLDELVGKKRSGNPGFDFHSQNKITDTVIFGEAKYIATTTAYSSALPQIVDFIKDGKDVEDLPELKPFCTMSALQRAADGRKGFSAAFSAKTTNTDRIIANITKRQDFQSLLQYEELILVAVDL